ncbi:uncharacterized protein METZ01_LOCUS422661, partial [marine metagenome]
MRVIERLCAIAKRQTAYPAQGGVVCVFCHHIMQSSSRRQAITGMTLYPVLRRFGEPSPLSYDGGECKRASSQGKISMARPIAVDSAQCAEFPYFNRKTIKLAKNIAVAGQFGFVHTR